MSYHLRERLSCDDIVELAMRESGNHAPDAALLDRVSALVGLLNDRGPYTPDQVLDISRQVQGLLARRMRMLLDRQRFAGIAEETIERPIFIVGFPRSGTSLIHSLIAEDPEVLAPQSWHMYSPSPPPGAGPVVSQRIAYAQRMVEEWMDFCPAQRPMHPYIDKGAFQLCEDQEVMALDFRNTYCYHFYKAPTLDYFVQLSTDMADSLRFHREFLQHFQWNTGKTRWVCKDPAHQSCLAELFEVYPDALCIWAHRPMGEIFASILTLSVAIFDTISGRPTDFRNSARQHAEGMKAGFDRLLENALIDDPRVMHLPFRDITADPLGVIRSIYDRQGLEVSPEFETRVRAWLADPDNAVDRYGRYPYSYEQLGLEREWVEELFADYSQRFGLV
jgi:hypothetical protein